MGNTFITCVMLGALCLSSGVIFGYSLRSLQHLKTYEYLLMKLESQVKHKNLHTSDLASHLSKLLPAVPDSTTPKEVFLDNPLTVLVMVRRLAEDWVPLIAKLRAKTVGGLSSLETEDIRFPSDQEVAAAAQALMRNQLTYNLSIELLANSILAGNSIPANISASDCFKAALEYYKHSYFPEATAWLEQALQKIDKGDSSVCHQTVMQYLASALCFIGNRASFEEIMSRFLRNSTKISLEDDLYYYYVEIAKMDCKSLSNLIGEAKRMNEYEGQPQSEMESHRRLCRGEGGDRVVGSELRCRYVHYHQPHLKLQPFKLEEIQLEPPVLRFHDVITDKESEILRKDAMAYMKRATVSLSYRISDYRTSHYAWLKHGYSVVGDRLTQRIAQFTGPVSTFKAEPHQLSRYGVSGEYLQHHDFLEIDFHKDRLATLMFYLTDVKEGGNTVFLTWNLTVPAIKNSAVLWFNYKPNGIPDYTSDHSGCPVLRGSKWVLNKWIKHEGNEFTMNCGLHENASFKYYYL